MNLCRKLIKEGKIDNSVYEAVRPVGLIENLENDTIEILFSIYNFRKDKMVDFLIERSKLDASTLNQYVVKNYDFFIMRKNFFSV